MIGEELFLEGQTEKGNEFLEQFSELLSDTDDTASVEEEKESIRSITKKLPYSSLSLEGWGAGKTDEKFDEIDFLSHFSDLNQQIANLNN